MSAHDRHIRFTWPDPVLAARQPPRSSDVWMSGPTPQDSDLMQVPHVGEFARVLLPVRLTEGHTLTFGVWLALEHQQFTAAVEVWWAPSYESLRLEGLVANAVPPWGLSGAAA